MSGRLYAWAWRQDILPAPKLSAAAAKAVLLYLVERADRDGWAWPAVETIANFTALDARTVRRALAALVTQGVTIAEARHRATTRYRLGVLRAGTPSGGTYEQEADEGSGAHLPEPSQPRHNAHSLPGHDAHPEPRHHAQANTPSQPGHGGSPAWAPGPSSLGMGAPQPGHGAPRYPYDPPRDPLNDPPTRTRDRAQGEILTLTAEPDRPTAKRKKRAAKDAEHESFGPWIAEYPRVANRRDASAAYNRALADGFTPAQLLIALRRYPFTDEARYIPYPAKWLKDRRWEDAPEAVAPPPKKAGKWDTLANDWAEFCTSGPGRYDDSEFAQSMRGAFEAMQPQPSSDPNIIDGTAEEVS